MFFFRWLFRAVFFILTGFWIAAVWLRPFIFDRRRRQARGSGTHGTARFAKPFELLMAGVLSGVGPVVGKGPWGRLIRFTRDGLVMVFASTGSGKGLGIVVPTLLDYPGSILVTDPKGENYAITQRRRKKFGRVIMLNPTDLARSDRFNPLDMIRADSAQEADDALALAGLMIKPDDKEPEHWNAKASSLLSALILHTLAEPPETRTLAHVRMLSVGGPETFRALLQDIAENSSSLKAAEIAGGFLATIPEKSERAGEFESILSTLHKATEPWSAGAPAGILSSESTFQLSDLVESTCTVFLCVDEELLGVYERWLRVMTGCALRAIMRGKHSAKRSPHKVVLLLDEVAVLGPLEPLEKQSGLLRAYCTPVLIWQNIPQAVAVYGRDRAPAFLANASCRVFFGVNDNETAHYAATMLGNTTILTSSQGVSQSSDAWLRQNRQAGESEGGYWLMDPSEIQRLPVTRLVIKFRDVTFPVLARRVDYRHVLRWVGQWDAWRGSNPAAAPARTRRDPPADPPAPDADAPRMRPPVSISRPAQRL